MVKQHVSGLLLDETCILSLAELSRACRMHAEWITELVEEGILEPSGQESYHWQFSGISLERARIVKRLQQDLGINIAGAALVLELMAENQRLRARLHLYEQEG